MSLRNAEELIGIINQISDQNPDYENTLDSLLSVLHRLAIAQVAPGAIDNSFGDGEKIKELAAKFSAEDLQLYYQIGVKSRDELKFSMEVKSAFEMLLLRMLIFSPSFTNILANTEFKGKDGQVFNFLLSEDQSAVYSEEIIPKLSLALSELLGEEVKVNIEIGRVEKETPAMSLRRLKQEAREEMIDEFEKDENVQEMLKHFSAKLSKESIAPIKE